MRWTKWLIVSLLACWLVSCPSEALAIPCTLDSSSVERYGVIEQDFYYPTGSINLNDRWEAVTVSVDFTTPSGRQFSIDGFYYQDDTYMVRFTPDEVGSYIFSVTLEGPSSADNVTYDNCTFVSTPSNNKGFLRANPNNPYYLITEADGLLFNGLGFNDCWDKDPANNPSSDPLYGFIDTGEAGGWVGSEQYFDTYGDLNGVSQAGEQGAGFNFFRWNPGNCSFGIFGSINTSKNYYNELESKLGDYLLKTAKEHGFKIMFSFFRNNPPYPYLGDPLEEEAVKRAIRYALARYGPYVDIWEWLNENCWDHSQPCVPSDAWLDYYTQYLHSIDPYQRLVSNSYARDGDWQYLDYRVYHLGVQDGYRTANMYSRQDNTNVPLVIGEGYNTNYDTSPRANWSPLHADRIRVANWTSFMAGMPVAYWNNSYCQCSYGDNNNINVYIGPEERLYTRIQQILTADLDQHISFSEISSQNPKVYALQSNDQVFVYVFQLPQQTTTPTSKSFSINLPFSGTASWIEPKTGNVLQTFSVTTGFNSLTTPSFLFDVVLKVSSSASASPSPSPNPACQADVDGNQVVESNDLVQVLNSWGQVLTGVLDINNDGKVNGLDLSWIIEEWGSSCN